MEMKWVDAIRKALAELNGKGTEAEMLDIIKELEAYFCTIKADSSGELIFNDWTNYQLCIERVISKPCAAYPHICLAMGCSQ
jgi:hypothetical protein